ncbi:MAG: tetratricopeptide repeat protein [Chloroflexi bacterium]|nr:tetratricopeptide repeat protein [Chloroflexota bacterium]
MADIASAIREALERLNRRQATEDDLRLLQEAKGKGVIRLAVAGGQRSVAIAGDAEGSTILTGDIVLTKEALEWLFPPTLYTLGAPVADFTGRTADIAELTAALKPDGRCDSALISGLRGMGGIGKTELARKVGQLLAADYPDAQLEIALQVGDAPKTPEQVLAEVVRAFAPAAKLPDSLGELQALCRQVMAGARGFLLLDNAADAAQVRPLLPPPAGWAVVVTSRRRFALHGACLDKNLDVLSPKDAGDLIRRILKAGGRAVTDEQVARIADLCGRLPLALRIAASFLVQNRTWPVEEYIAALEAERLKHLDAEGEGSVRASLEVSVRQLEKQSPALARRWRLLGVFPAPFERQAAAAVWGKEGEFPSELPDLGEEVPQELRDVVAQLVSALAGQRVPVPLPDDETRDALTELYRWSLVEYDEAKGTYALHDLLREYALAEPPEGLDGARRRHAAYYLAAGSAADDLYKTDAVEGLRRFDAALPHLRAAWAWMKEIFGRGGPAARPYDKAAARWLSDFASRMAYVLDLRMTPRERIPVLEAALEAARHLGDKRAQGAHLGNLGLAYADLGDPRRAIGFYEQHLAIARETGDRCGEGAALGNLGLAYADLGDPRRAIAFYEQRLAIAREIGDRRGEGNALGCLAIAYQRLGEAEKAIPLYERAIAIAKEIGDQRNQSIHSWNLGLLAEQRGDYARAAELMQVRVDYEQAIGHPDAEKDAAYLAEVRAKAGR